MVQGFGWFRYLITESGAGKSGAEGRTSVCLFKNVGIISKRRPWQAAVQILLACCLQISWQYPNFCFVSHFNDLAVCVYVCVCVFICVGILEEEA